VLLPDEHRERKKALEIGFYCGEWFAFQKNYLVRRHRLQQVGIQGPDLAPRKSLLLA